MPGPVMPGPMPPPMMPPMPPMFGPPMMMPPGGFFPPPPKKSFARTIFTTLAGIVFGLSVTMNIYLLMASGLAGGFRTSHGVTQTVISEGSSSERIAVLPVSGVIMENTTAHFEQMMALLEKDSSVKAVVLEVDTPGGGVTASDEIHARIKRFKADHPNVPVVVTMGAMATSGGYYVSCAADYIFAQPTTLTGNIGVLLPRYNASKLANQYGIEEVTITAPEKGFKNAGSMFNPVKPEETAYLQGLINQAYATFKDVVNKGRAGKLTKSIDSIADGRVLTLTEAMQLGLVDAKGYAVDAYRKAAAMAGLSKPEVVRYDRQPSLLDLFGGQARAAAGAGGVTINGVNVNIDSHLLDELSRPRLMYLWRGQ